MKDLLEIDGARLWQSLTDMARVGATRAAACGASRSPVMTGAGATCSRNGAATRE